MSRLYEITNEFTEKSRLILNGNLVGVYLHGSAVMGCFSEERSDIDLIVAVNTEIPDEGKARFMDMVVKLNTRAPKKGIEFSAVRACVCNPFVYPTPFELHFSVMHLPWYNSDPKDYIERMKGTDKDLAAHFTVIRHRGRCLYGKPIDDVFGEVDGEYFLDSIRHDVENAAREIMLNPAYIVLNLCRVAAYRADGMLLSKKEGGEWGLKILPERYHGFISQALEEYTSGTPFTPDEVCAREYADDMLNRINM